MKRLEIDVVARLSWPNAACTEARLVPALTCCVAKVWRRACTEASLIPASAMYFSMTRWIARVDMERPNLVKKRTGSASVGSRRVRACR
jgi:hypothetical protein